MTAPDLPQITPGRLVARVSQPVVDAVWARRLQEVIGQKAVGSRLDGLRCNDDEALTPALLQQAVAYGDFTAQLIEAELYDPKIRALTNDPAEIAKAPRKQAALAALKSNPVLARNVVLLALRHSIEDSLGGIAKAEAVSYRQTYYQLAVADFGSAVG